jgi:hypothetical protein
VDDDFCGCSICDPEHNREDCILCGKVIGGGEVCVACYEKIYRPVPAPAGVQAAACYIDPDFAMPTLFYESTGVQWDTFSLTNSWGMGDGVLVEGRP